MKKKPRVKKRKTIVIPRERIFLTSKNDPLPESFLSRKLIRIMKKLTFVERNYLMQKILQEFRK